MPYSSVYHPIFQASNHFAIDPSAADVPIEGPNGEKACTLFVANDDASPVTVSVWLADQDPTDGDQDPQTYSVASGTFLPLLVRQVNMSGTSADTIIGLTGKGSGR